MWSWQKSVMYQLGGVWPQISLLIHSLIRTYMDGYTWEDCEDPYITTANILFGATLSTLLTRLKKPFGQLQTMQFQNILYIHAFWSESYTVCWWVNMNLFYRKLTFFALWSLTVYTWYEDNYCITDHIYYRNLFYIAINVRHHLKMGLQTYVDSVARDHLCIRSYWLHRCAGRSGPTLSQSMYVWRYFITWCSACNI